MPLPLTLALLAMGTLYLVFARIPPPRFLEPFVRVPGLFVFLPDAYVQPVGRAASGLLLIGTALALAWRYPPS